MNLFQASAFRRGLLTGFTSLILFEEIKVRHRPLDGIAVGVEKPHGTLLNPGERRLSALDGGRHRDDALLVDRPLAAVFEGVAADVFGDARVDAVGPQVER